jgi:hypothetical protein
MVRLTGLALLSVFILTDLAAAQSIEEHRRRCNSSRSQDCTNLRDGPALSSCLMNNANIEHSCNAVMNFEQRTGQGPKFKGAQGQGQKTNRRMEADED